MSNSLPQSDFNASEPGYKSLTMSEAAQASEGAWLLIKLGESFHQIVFLRAFEFGEAPSYELTVRVGGINIKRDVSAELAPLAVIWAVPESEFKKHVNA